MKIDKKTTKYTENTVARYKNPAPIKVSSINLNSDNHVNIVNTTKNNPNYQQN